MKASSAVVLRLLRERPEGITSRDAWLDAGCSRLAARISDLKAEGFTIEAELVNVQSGDRVARVALYRLVEARELVLGL